MSRPGFGVRIALVLGAAFLIVALVSPLLKPVFDWLVTQHPEAADEILHLRMQDGAYDFGRIHRRLLMLVALILIVACRRWLGRVPFEGMARGAPRFRSLGIGLAGGVGSWLVFLGALAMVGRRTLHLDFPPDWPAQLAGAAAAALLIGLIEEAAVRGYLLGGLRSRIGQLAAVLATAGFYAILHFYRTAVPVEPGGFRLTVGFETMAAHAAAAVDPGVLPGFVGLLLVGVVLSYAYLWSRSLPLAIGLHAGWVFMIMLEEFVVAEYRGVRGLYGDDGILAGPLGWGFLLLTLLAMRPLAAWWAGRAPVTGEPA